MFKDFLYGLIFLLLVIGAVGIIFWILFNYWYVVLIPYVLVMAFLGISALGEQIRN